MHLLVLTTSFPSQAYPGSGVFIKRMLASLPDDIQVTVVTPDHDRSYVPFDDGRIRVKSFRYAPRSWQILAHRPGGIPMTLQQQPGQWLLVPFFFLAMVLAAYKEACKADVINAHWSLCGVVAGLVGWVLGKPVVTTLRGQDVYRSGTSGPFRWMLRTCAALNDHMITVSSAMAAALVQMAPGSKGRVSVIPNGVQARFSSLRTNAEVRRLITIGSLISLKKMETVIQAFVKLTELYGSLQLEIVGDGPQRKHLTQLAHDLGVADRVLFTGMIDPEQVADRLMAGSIFILASSMEGRPNVILEAMAAEVPVVASDIPGVRELVGDDERGLLFQVGDAVQLASLIQRLVKDDGLAARLTGSAKQWLRDQGLTWDNTARRYAEIFRGVL